MMTLPLPAWPVYNMCKTIRTRKNAKSMVWGMFPALNRVYTIQSLEEATRGTRTVALNHWWHAFGPVYSGKDQTFWAVNKGPNSKQWGLHDSVSFLKETSDWRPIGVIDSIQTASSVLMQLDNFVSLTSISEPDVHDVVNHRVQSYSVLPFHICATGSLVNNPTWSLLFFNICHSAIMTLQPSIKSNLMPQGLGCVPLLIILRNP